MKLPGINYGEVRYNPPMQDINAPLRASRAQAQVLAGASDAIDAWGKARAEDQARDAAMKYRKDMTPLSATLAERPVIALDDPLVTPEMRQQIMATGVEQYKQPDGTYSIPTHVIATKLYDTHRDALRVKYRDSLGGDARRMFDRLTYDFDESNATQVIKTGIRHETDMLAGRALERARGYAQAGDSKAAVAELEAGYRNGYISADRYLAEKDEIVQDAALTSHMLGIVKSNDYRSIAAAGDAALADTTLSPSQRLQLYNMADSRLGDIEARAAKAQTAASQQRVNAVLFAAYSNHKPIPWETVREIAPTLTPADAYQLITANNALENSINTSGDPVLFTRIMAGVEQASLINDPVKRQAAMDRAHAELIIATGQDASGNIIGVSQLSASQVGQISSRIQELRTASPVPLSKDAETALSNARLTITGAFPGADNATGVQAFAEFERKFYSEWRASGGRLDPWAWMDKNVPSVVAGSEGNEEYGSHLARPFRVVGEDGYIDLAASQAKVREAERSKTLSEQEATKALDSLNAENIRAGVLRKQKQGTR